MKLEILFEGEDTHIRGDDFAISSTNNLMVFALAKFLSDNAIKDTIFENKDKNSRHIEFEVKDDTFEKIIFSI